MQWLVNGKARKAVLWRPMYDPAGHGMLRDHGKPTVTPASL
jgi:hypothetical protein